LQYVLNTGGLGVLLASMIWLVLAGTDRVADLSPEGRALIAAVQASLDDVRTRHAQSPPPEDDAERLVRLGELDQAPRRVVTSFDFSTVPEAEREAVLRAAVAPMEAADEANQAELLKLLPEEGWFLRSRYGEKASRAAFHIVQHAGPDLQRRFLPVLEELVQAGEVDGQSFGMMFDRVAISEGRPQRYGSQFRCDGGKWRPYPLEDRARVEALRAEIGFGWSFAENVARMEAAPPCPQTRSPPPPGMKMD
jgi:hypothetical protein